MGKEQFVGVWELISAEWTRSDGKVNYLFGPDPVGRLVYTKNGHMFATVMRRHRTPFASGDARQGTPEEIKTAYEGFIFYYGTYEVDNEEGVVIHHVEHSSFPNWDGGDQRRFFEFLGERLKLWHDPILIEGVEITGTLIWERIERG